MASAETQVTSAQTALAEATLTSTDRRHRGLGQPDRRPAGDRLIRLWLVGNQLPERGLGIGDRIHGLVRRELLRRRTGSRRRRTVSSSSVVFVELLDGSGRGGVDGLVHRQLHRRQLPGQPGEGGRPGHDHRLRLDDSHLRNRRVGRAAGHHYLRGGQLPGGHRRDREPDRALRRFDAPRSPSSPRSLQDVIVVPTAAIQYSGTGTTVSLDSQGQKVGRTVTIGAASGGDTQVTSGLSVGDKIYVTEVTFHGGRGRRERPSRHLRTVRGRRLRRGRARLRRGRVRRGRGLRRVTGLERRRREDPRTSYPRDGRGLDGAHRPAPGGPRGHRAGRPPGRHRGARRPQDLRHRSSWRWRPCGASRSTSKPESTWPSWVPRDPASRLSCTSWVASTSPRRARFRLAGEDVSVDVRGGAGPRA